MHPVDAPLPPAHSSQLKAGCLSYPEVIAESISTIAPSTVPAAIFGLIFAVAGNGTWLSFFLGMIGLVFVGSTSINLLAVPLRPARCTPISSRDSA